MFAEEFLPDVRVTMKAHHLQRDYEELHKDIHLLKGASGFAVASRVYRLSVELQRVVPSVRQPVISRGEARAIDQLLQGLDFECDAFLDHYAGMGMSASAGAVTMAGGAPTLSGSKSLPGPPPALSPAAEGERDYGRIKTPDELKLQGVRVLYGEDNPFCVEVIRTYLKHCGATVVASPNGTALVSKLLAGDEHFDCVLMGKGERCAPAAC